MKTWLKDAIAHHRQTKGAREALEEARAVVLNQGWDARPYSDISSKDACVAGRVPKNRME